MRLVCFLILLAALISISASGTNASGILENVTTIDNPVGNTSQDVTTTQGTTAIVGSSSTEETAATIGSSTTEETTATIVSSSIEGTTATVGSSTTEGTSDTIGSSTTEGTTATFGTSSTEGTPDSIGSSTTEEIAATSDSSTTEENTATFGSSTTEEMAATIGSSTTGENTVTIGSSTTEETTATIGSSTEAIAGTPDSIGSSSTEGTTATFGSSTTEGTSDTIDSSTTEGTTATFGTSSTEGTPVSIGSSTTEEIAATSGSSTTEGTSDTTGSSTTEGTTATSDSSTTEENTVTIGSSTTEERAATIGSSTTEESTATIVSSSTEGTTATIGSSTTEGTTATVGTSSTEGIPASIGSSTTEEIAATIGSSTAEGTSDTIGSSTTEGTTATSDSSTTEGNTVKIGSSTTEEMVATIGSSTTEGTTATIGSSTIEENTATIGSSTTDENTATIGSSTTDENTVTIGSSTTEGTTATIDSSTTEGTTATVGTSSTEGTPASIGSSTTEENTVTIGSSNTEENTATIGSSITEEMTATFGSSTTEGTTATIGSSTTEENTATIGSSTTEENTVTIGSSTTEEITATIGSSTTEENTTTIVSSTTDGTTATSGSLAAQEETGLTTQAADVMEYETTPTQLETITPNNDFTLDGLLVDLPDTPEPTLGPELSGDYNDSLNETVVNVMTPTPVVVTEPYYMNYTATIFITNWFQYLDHTATICSSVVSIPEAVTTSTPESTESSAVWTVTETQINEFNRTKTVSDWLQYIEDTTTGCETTTMSTTTIPTTTITNTTIQTTVTTSSTSTAPPCIDGPCQNGGSYCPGSEGIYTCTCINDFKGDLCQTYDGLQAVANLDTSSADSFTVVGQVMDALIGTAVNDSGSNTSLTDVSSTISLLVGNLASANWTGEQLEAVGTNLVQGSSSILSSLLTQNSGDSCSSSGPCQNTQETAAVVENVVASVVNLGSVVLKNVGEGSFNVQSENMNVTFNKAPVESLTKSSANQDVVVPGSLVDTLGQKGIILAKMDINKDIFSHAANQIKIAGAVKRLNMETDTGESVGPMDADDPLVISADTTSNDPFVALNLHAEGSTLTAVQEVALSSNSPITVTEIMIPPQTKVLFRGKFGELPRKYVRDFEGNVDTDVQNVLVHKHVKSQFVSGQLILIFESAKMQADVVFIVLEFTASTNSRRRRRSFSNPTMRSRTLAPKVWNPTTLTWDNNPNVAVSGISATGQTQFKSNFFGTFAVSELIVAPTPIDFNRLFLNFATYLKDSPYVLAVNCFLVAMTITVAILLRRIDKGDKELWRYFPLVDNREDAPHTYSISVHTSLRSARNLSVTPCFILSGSERKTKTRLLTDGCRKNFIPGTVSNFFLTTDVNLGEVQTIKIWHDNAGHSTKWHLDRIVLVDLEKTRRYLFICQKWLALGEDDGRICRTFKAYTDQEEINMLDILSKQKLFDDHLWLSVFKRPTFSRFSRVQRFLCAVAMLFLSMVTSAMWYQDYDSGTQKSSGLEIGPISLNYRQVFVGAASAVIIMIPGVLMTVSFKKRRLRGETVVEEKGRCSCLGYFTGKKLFPWWFVFVGYFFVVASVGASAFFTFMYSLQWGGTTSLNWLMSLIFCTTGSTAFVEPVKIIILSIALSMVFKKSAQEDIGIIAPLETEKDIKVLAFVPPKVMPEPPDDDAEEIEIRRRDLFLKNKLINVGKSIIIKLIFVGILTTICLHNDVMDTYRLNTFIKTYANEGYLAKHVSKHTDVWAWLDTVFIPSLIPKNKYNGQLMAVYDQRFAADQANLRIGPISLRQYRIKGTCEDNVLPSRYGLPMRCLPDYKLETAEIGTFKEGWTNCNATGTDCIEKPYKLTTSIGGSTVNTDGTFGSYGDGSYIESWDQDQTYASSRNKFLEQNDWLDSSSRALIVEASLYNPNVGLFTRLQVLFEFPAVGSVTYNVDVKSAKLYPYIYVWDYIVLLLQLIFIVMVLVRMCMFFRSACCLRNKMECSDVLMFWFEMLLSVGAAAVYGVKIDRTIFVVEELRNNPDSFVSFDLVHLLDDIYRFLISLLLFVRIIFLLEPMKLSKSLFFMRATLTASQKELWSFFLVLIFVVTSFMAMFYLLEGPITYDIRSIVATYLTLFEGLLGMVKSSQFIFAVSGLEMYLKQGMFVFFFFSSTMILINIAIIILSTDLAAIQGHKDFKFGPEFDQELNDYLWRSIGDLLNKISSKSSRKDDHDGTDGEETKCVGDKVNKIKDMLDRILITIANTSDTDAQLADILTQKALSRLSSVQPINVRHTYNTLCDKQHSLGEQTPEPGTAMITLSVNDAMGRACLKSATPKRSSNDITVKVCDVTEKERIGLTRDLRTLYGKVYKCETTLNLQKWTWLNLQYLITTECHPYEDVVIAIRSEHAKNWTFLKSTYNTLNRKDKSCYNSMASIEAVCDYIPDYITCVSEQKRYVHTVTPSGGEFSPPFEPESKFIYSHGCLNATCDVEVKLIPQQPVPIVQIIPNGNLLCPVRVVLPVASSISEYGPDLELLVLCSTSESHWWKLPTQVTVNGGLLEFNAYIGPANIKVSFCVKVSEIIAAKRPSPENSDILNSDTLTDICDMVGGQWPDLGKALGLQNPNIYMMMSYPHVTTPSNICRHMLAVWYKKLPVTIDRTSYLKTALKKIKREDIADILDAKERSSGPSFVNSIQGSDMIKGFNTVIRNERLCKYWLRLAESFSLTQEAITQIDCETPRINSEKAFLVLMTWWQKNPGATLLFLQRSLIKAGFPLVARKLDGCVSPLERRQSFSIAARRLTSSLVDKRQTFSSAERRLSSILAKRHSFASTAQKLAKYPDYQMPNIRNNNNI